MKNKEKRDWKSIIGIIVLISFIAPIAFIIYKIIVSPTTNVEQIEGVRVKTDYILMLTQCVLGVIAFFLPNMLSKKLKIVIPTNMYIFIKYHKCMLLLNPLHEYIMQEDIFYMLVLLFRIIPLVL